MVVEDLDGFVNSMARREVDLDEVARIGGPGHGVDGRLRYGMALMRGRIPKYRGSIGVRSKRRRIQCI